MYGSVRSNSLFADQFIAVEKLHRGMLETAQLAWSIRESETAFGRRSDRWLATVRRGLGVALIRAGERLRGAPAAAAQAATQSATG